MSRRKNPTWTTLVVEALRTQDDFMDNEMLRKATGGNVNQISAALIHLLKHRVAGVEVNADGKGWWYARPTEEDDRVRTHDEIAAEIKKPRRISRKPRILPPVTK